MSSLGNLPMMMTDLGLQASDGLLESAVLLPQLDQLVTNLSLQVSLVLQQLLQVVAVLDDELQREIDLLDLLLDVEQLA